MLTIAANKDEGEGITANVTGIRLEEDGLMVAAVHAAGVLTSGEGRIVTDGGGDRRQDVAQLLLDGIPIDEGTPGLLGIATQAAGVPEGPGALLLLGVQHGGIVGAELHQKDLGVVHGSPTGGGGGIVEDLVVPTGLPVIFPCGGGSASLLFPIVFSVHFSLVCVFYIYEVSRKYWLAIDSASFANAFCFTSPRSYFSVCRCH